MLLNTGVMATTISNIASYFSVPTIGMLYTPDSSNGFVAFFQQLNNIFNIGIPVYPDKYEERGGNQIGEQVLVGGLGEKEIEPGSGGKLVVGALTKVADNIVVTPRSWIIHGYIGFKYDGIGGFIGAGLPAMIPVPALSSFLQSFGRDVLNDLMKRCLRYISEARRPFKFTTADGETLPALLKSYSIRQIAENNNWVEVDLEIQEFRFIALAMDTKGNAVQEAVGGVSGVYSSLSQMGTAMGRTALRVLGV